MPYRVEKRKDKYVVISEGSGRVLGTHTSREKAMAQVRALYANMADAKKKGRRARG